MREVCVEVEDYPGCCAARVLAGFNDLYIKDGNGWDTEVLDKKPLTDDEWYKMFLDLTADTVIDVVKFPFVSFAHSDENLGVFTPRRLARWLRSKGERVDASRKIRNPSSGNRVTVYIWSPSETFRKTYNNKKTQTNAEQRGTIAA